MAVNGRVGRAKFFARYKRELIKEGTERGYDMSSRSARAAFERQRSIELHDRIRADIAKRKTEVSSHED